MTDLRVDLDAVRQLGTDLGHVADELEQANARSDRIAAAVGHEHLARTVRKFAHDWDDTRKKITGSVRALADASTQVAEAFEQTDHDLAHALTDAS